MAEFSRRDLIGLGVVAASGLAVAPGAENDDLHEALLAEAARLERQRRARFGGVRTNQELTVLQDDLRRTFLRLLGGLPERTGVPPARVLGRIEGDAYTVEKLVYESFPGYLVPALLYVPKGPGGRRPAVLSPCGHSTNGKAAEPYQTLHANLASRGFVVLTYDPVGQGERSQFWDRDRRRSRFNLSCGEHAVLGNALELLGTGMARYRIWDGLRGFDYLVSRPEVIADRIGCVGNSGGGNLTAYLAAIEPRIAAAAICCYITALPQRMGNRIQEDPSSDPEQDVFGLVSEGIDHAGLLALCAPRPTLIGSATLDFFPIAGARESFGEARRLYAITGAEARITKVESPTKHGLNRTIREAVYAWFGRWLAGRDDPEFARELPFSPRPDATLRVCENGQANLSLGSRPLLPMAYEEFRRRPRPSPKPLAEVLRLDVDRARPVISQLGPERSDAETLLICINGNDAPDWRSERTFLDALGRSKVSLAVVDPRGVGPRRVPLTVGGHDYTDPISGVEANLAYNAFLVGQTLLGLRVSDVLAAVKTLRSTMKPRRVILCGSHDAALVACFAAAVDPAVERVATEGLLLSFDRLFAAEGYTLNAASIVPGLLRDFGDVPDVLERIRPRPILLATPLGTPPAGTNSFARPVASRFRAEPGLLAEWLRGD